MTDEPLYVGGHWSGDAWVGVAFTPAAFDHADVYAEIGELWLEYEETAERILVDVPVGLVTDGDAIRECDRLARSILGPQGERIVTPPVREAIRKRRYATANRAHERKTGTELEQAAFDLNEPIAAVDELLQELPEARPVFAASHPEVCYRAFAGEPLQEDPTTAGGYAERMRALVAFDREAAPTVQSAAEATAGAAVSVQDVLDAVALGYTARPGPGELQSLPPDPPTDSTGLPIEFVYRSEQPLID